MLLVDARRAARLGAGGEMILLSEQDRSRWDRAHIDEGQALVRRCLRWNRPGPYQIQAAINAVHSDARTAVETDWPQILALYDQLAAIAPSAIVALNRAVAVAEVHGPHAALTLVEALALDGYHLFHAIRADLLRRLGRLTEAAAAYDLAVARTDNAAERAFLQKQRAAMDLSRGSFVTIARAPAG
jgi:RNA polymerase sigma-70 factor (ECF subfamily)